MFDGYCVMQWRSEYFKSLEKAWCATQLPLEPLPITLCCGNSWVWSQKSCGLQRRELDNRYTLEESY